MNNRYCFITPMFNASKTLARLLHSMCAQSYGNWKLFLIDDISSQEELQKCTKIFDKFADLLIENGDDPSKLVLIQNSQKRWEMANVLLGISHCNDDDIICRIDADDALSDIDALSIIDSYYQQTNCDALWTMHRWGLSDRNISAPMENSANVYVHPWVSSHMKTFCKVLINDVPYENFVNHNNTLIQRAGDQGLYLPVLHRAKKRIFVPRVMYHYSIDEQGGAVYQTDDAKFQKVEAEFIRSRGYVNSGISWEKQCRFVKNK